MIDVPVGYKQTDVGVIPDDWELKKLGDFIHLRRGHDLTAYNRRQGEVPVMGSAGQNGFHDIALVKGSGVVLGRSGASFGQAHFCETDFWPHNTALYVTDFLGNDRRYVFYFLSSFNFTNHNSGGAQQSLNRNFIAPILIKAPPPTEQTAIATALSDVDALLNQLDKLIAKKRDIKQATMQQLLTGKKRLAGFGDGKGYKQTEIGEIPEDWDCVGLGDIGENLIGLTYSPNDVKAHGTLVLRSSNIQKNKLAFDDNVYVDMDLPKRVMVKQGDILLCVRNGSRQLIGKCALIDKTVEGAAFGAFMSVYRSVYSQFVFYQFQANVIQKQIEEVMGATINQITNKDLSSFKIAFPKNKAEQTAIATLLTDMDTEITQLQQRRHKTHALKQGMMQQLLTGKIRLI